MVERLSEYPYVIVRLACRYCPRRGSYRAVRLAAKYGAEITLFDLLDKLAFDCVWRRPPGARPPNQYDPKCGATFIDLEEPSPPHDVPPSARRLRVVK
jgi:hypothetical protein